MTSPEHAVTAPAHNQAAGAERAAADGMPTAGSDLLAAAGPGYGREWALFCDYAAATDQPAMPTTMAALTGFLTALPAAPATTARRIRAIAAAHRRAGHLLERPTAGPGAPPSPQRRGPAPGPLIGACPTRGWPDGLAGRRDAFLIVLTEVLGLSHSEARGIGPDDLTVPDPGRGDQRALAVAGRDVPADDDPRRCPACAVVRWLEVLGLADGLGRGSARMALVAAHAPTAASPHRHAPTVPARWRGAPVLLPAIDRHGWHDDYRPMTPRAIRARLARAAGRTEQGLGEISVPETEPTVEPRAQTSELGLEEALSMLDDLADDADALTARIQALLELDGSTAP